MVVPTTDGHPIKRVLFAFRAKAAKRFKVTTDSKHNRPVAENLLEQDFTAERPNQKWAGGITYLWTDQGWVYLAVILDLPPPPGHRSAMSDKMTTTLVCDALQMALWRRKLPKGGHRAYRDRGSQYCSGAYRHMLRQHGLVCSMSGKGNCYDNACVESFFHSMKIEAVHGERFATRHAIRREVFETIETFYNTIRQHSTLGYISPETFEAKSVT